MDPYLGEIKLCAFPFAPRGWAFCNGALLPVNQNQALFSLLGVQYGGDGRLTFALPDLRGRAPVHYSATLDQGSKNGVESVTLTVDQMPVHTHMFHVSTSPAKASGAGLDKNMVLAASNLYDATNPSVTGPGQPLYANAPQGSAFALHAMECGNAGGGLPHENMQSSLVMNYIIAVNGIYPTRD